MVLATAGRLQEVGINCFTQSVTLAVDVEIRCVYMAYSQTSMYGLPAVVLHGNTITCEEFSRWYTPMYLKDKWVWKAPLGFAASCNASDELLKLATEPMYAAMRQAERLFRDELTET